MWCSNENNTEFVQWILLTTTAIVAFAGAAAADGHAAVGFGGSAALGYNDDIEDGFYWDADIDVTGTAALDNGLTATAAFGFDVVEDNLGQAAITGDYVLSIASESASLSFGDVDPVAEANYGGVSGSPIDFNDQDAHFAEVDPDTIPDNGDEHQLFDAILVGEATVAGVTAMLSYGVSIDPLNTTITEDLDALQLYATGDFDMVSVEGAYQGEVAGDGTSIIGLSASTTVAGAELTGAYLAQDGFGTDETSIGVAVAYPVGPVTLGGYYSSNDVAEDGYGVSADYVSGPVAVNGYYEFDGNTGSATEEAEFGVEGSYDTGLNLTVLAGYISTEVGGAGSTAQTYVAGVYDLGGGAELLVSYAEDEANAANDEIGDPEYMHGTTVEVSFAF